MAADRNKMEDIFIYLIVISIGTTFSVFNIFTIIVILLMKKLRSSITIRPILSFLLASTIQGLTAAPIYVYKRLEHSEHVRDWLCDAHRVTYFLCGHVMKMSLVLISMERLMAIKYPFRYREHITRRRITILTILIWTITLIIDTAPFYDSGSTIENCVYIPNRSWGLCVIVIFNIIPFFIILVSYILMWIKAARVEYLEKTLRRHFKINQNSIYAETGIDSFRSKKESVTQKNCFQMPKQIKFALEMKATKTSLALIAVYVICWGPLGVFYMIDHFCYNCLSQDDHLKLTRALIKILSFSSSILAPVVYCWWNRDFRYAAKKMWTKYVRRSVENYTLPVELTMYSISSK